MSRLPLLLPCLTLLCLPLAAQRTVLQLDGEWQIEESVDAAPAPSSFTHTAPVPGLANLAQPPFAGVDLFDSRALINNRIRRKALPESARVTTAGVSRQQRNYFWYRRTFQAPPQRPVAILKVSKAQFGTAVWLNGAPVGEHPSCFTAAYFDVSGAIRWNQENTLLIRVGAHPGVLPPSIPAGTDFEKLKWTPGIYDSVSLSFSANPVIESVQVAPRVAAREILVETKLKNYGSAPAVARLRHLVKPHLAMQWKGGARAGQSATESVRLAPGEEQAVRQTVKIPGAKLWTPEQPFLYVLESDSGGDSLSTRFGMREFRFDTATGRAMLNNQVYFLRGSNITLHRFFEDPLCKALPWNRAWVRKLLGEIPKQLHWNTFRFCIGPVPDFWFDIADEAGLLIQNEYFIWTGRTEFPPEYTKGSLTGEFTRWMRDHWNHPSVALWDASNETIADLLRLDVIPAVRGLDLSNRPWDNGYNLPDAPDDPIEDHPYLFSRVAPGRVPPFKVTDLENLSFTRPVNAPHPSSHPVIINEYGWLWLNRDGTPTLLTGDVYETLIGADATPQQRLSLWAYYLGGLTEFWRSRRSFAGVLHFVYLTASFPGVYTSDHWRDVEKLELDPGFADYAKEAFKPLGVYLNFWQPSVKAGEKRRFAVSIINDEYENAKGTLSLELLDARESVKSRAETPFAVPALGQQSYLLDLEILPAAGDCLLRATARRADGQATVSRRSVRVTGN